MKKEQYKKYLFLYGFLTIVYLLDYLTEIEDYEECIIVKEVIQEINKEFKMDIPTTYGVEAIEMYRSSYLELGKSKSIREIEKESSRNAITRYNKIRQL